MSLLAARKIAQPGPLLNWGNLFYSGDLDGICNIDPIPGQWFNTGGFVRDPAQQPAAFHARVFPTRIGGCRGAGLNRTDANIQRTFRLKENLRFQLRMDALNLMNKTQFDVPNLDPTSTNFARVTNNTSSTMRYILIQGRIRF